ncbi:hypothetical protein Bca101_067063 [Brassica carinata]
MRETASHLFLHCHFATEIWNSAPIQQGSTLSTAPEFTTALKLSRKLNNLPPTGLHFGPLFPWIAWNKWTARNLKNFERRKFNTTKTLMKEISDAREWQNAQTKQLVLQQLQSQPEIYQPNREDIITIHTDAAWRKETLLAGLAWTFSNETGAIILQGTSTEDCVSSALMAEGLAMREALLQAQAHGISNIILKSDAQIIIRAINK